MEEKGKSAVRAVSFMMIITLLGKILGLVREQLLAAHYALGPEASAFLTASRIPRIFFDAVFASAISASFIPIFNEYLQKKGKQEAFRLSDQFITIVIMVTCILTVIGILFAKPLVWVFADGLFADGVNGDTAILCAQLLRILFPAIIFTGIAFSFVGILQSLEEFSVPAAMSVASNLVIILYYVLFNEKFGIYGLTIAFLIGWAMQAVIQIPTLWKKGYRYRPSFYLKDEGLKKIGVLMLPVMVSTWIQPINILINTKFASHIYKGAGINVIEYANTLYSIIAGVFVLSIANVIFPRLSRLTNNQDEKGFGETIRMTLKTMAFLLIPMMIGLMTLSEPIVRLMYQRGDFGAFATELTAQALFYFSLGMIGFGVQTILSRAFYAEQDGKTPFYSGLVSIALNIILCFLLVEKMKVGGLALASSVSSTVSALLLLIPMQRKKKGLLTAQFLKDLGKMLLASLIMMIVVLWMKDIMLKMFVDSLFSRIIIVCVPAGIGATIYMVITYFIQVEESRFAFGFIQKMVTKIRKR